MQNETSSVLLADDEHGFSLTTSRFLERHGFNCDVAHTADVACNLLEQKQYDVLVADIKMPGNDQLAFCEKVGEKEGAPAIVLVTGYPSVDTAVRSTELGVFAYKVKPFDLNEFVETVQEAARQAALKRRLCDHSRMMRAHEERIDLMRAAISGGAKSLDETAREYLSLVLLNLVESAMEAADLLCLLDRGDLAQPVRKLARHPEVEVLRKAISESVQVLEKTKNNFKSKELASLRKRLSMLLSVTS